MQQFGDFDENVAAFFSILEKHPQQGALEDLRELRAHILATREAKSMMWLLPRVEALLQE